MLPDSYELFIEDVRRLDNPEIITGRCSRYATEQNFYKLALRHRLFIPFWGLDLACDPNQLVLEAKGEHDDESEIAQCEHEDDSEDAEPHDVNCSIYFGR